MKFRQDYPRAAPEPDPDLEPEPERVRAPWDQAPREPPEAYALFVRYLTSTAPSLLGFVRAEGLIPGTVLALASRWRWHPRRSAYVQAIAHAGAEAAQESAQERARAHAALVLDLRGYARDELQRLRASGTPMDAKEVLAMAKAAIELDRLIAGETTANVGVDLSGATTEEIQALEAAYRKATAPASATNGRGPEPDGLN